MKLPQLLLIATALIGTCPPSLLSAASLVAVANEMSDVDIEIFKELQTKAENGDIDSQYKLGNAYMNGKGCEKNINLAEKWWVSASGKGDNRATQNLMFIYQKEGPKANVELWCNYLKRAADQGVGSKQLQLGVAYVSEYGTIKENLPLAYLWLSLSSEQNIQMAKDKLAQLIPGMTPVELKKGKDLLQSKRIQIMQRTMQKQIADLGPGVAGVMTKDGLKPLGASAATMPQSSPSSPSSAGLQPEKETKILELDFSQAKVRYQPPAPPYPADAKIDKIQGTVVVEVTIGPDGVPTFAQAKEGPRQLRATAEEYVMRWKFEPAMRNGAPQSARYKLTMPFRLR